MYFYDYREGIEREAKSEHLREICECVMFKVYEFAFRRRKGKDKTRTERKRKRRLRGRVRREGGREEWRLPVATFPLSPLCFHLPHCMCFSERFGRQNKEGKIKEQE